MKLVWWNKFEFSMPFSIGENANNKTSFYFTFFTFVSSINKLKDSDN
tara:strand:+ start:270 stop:410 length:141 start_codon:yes stop_codon:yes gene_type:complete